MGEIGKWFDLWFEDKQSMMATMRKNMVADLEAGYNPAGESIKRQIVEFDLYRMDFERQMDRFKDMDDKQVNRWCYLDLKKRGAIS